MCETQLQEVLPEEPEVLDISAEEIPQEEFIPAQVPTTRKKHWVPYVILAVIFVVCNAFINAGLPSFTGNYEDWAQTIIYLCEMTFTIALTVGSVKGAQSLTSKALGL